MDIFSLYRRLLAPFVVFSEVRREPARSFAFTLATERKLLVVPRLEAVDSLALRIFELVNADPSLPSIDPPEAYALAFAKHSGLPLLTDNASPKLAAMTLEELRGAMVLDSLDVLKALYPRETLLRVLAEFTEDTGVRFSERRLRELGLA
jgi:hypothetical protein